MIHIIVIHFKTSKWIDIQLKQIEKHFTNYKIWTYCDEFDISQHQHKFYFCQNSKIEKNKHGYIDHMLKLNSLTDIVLNHDTTQADDLLVWLDSDSFPVNNFDSYAPKKLAKYPLIAINRRENKGDIIPHPSFACTTVSFWKKFKLNWSGVPGKTSRINKHGLHDPGGKLYQDLLKNDIDWYRLRRTKSLTKHEVFFTIYDNFIYHHGAGSRPKGSRCRGGDFGAIYNEEDIFNRISKNIFAGNTNVTSI